MAKKIQRTQDCFESGYKECTGCYHLLPIKRFRKRLQKGLPYIVAKCRECETEYNKVHRDKENRRIKEFMRFQNPEKRAKKNNYQRKWRCENIEKNRAYHRKHLKRNVDDLTDSYVGRLLFKVVAKNEIPPSLIKLKRQHLICKRTLKLIHI